MIFVNRFFHPDHSATSQMLTDLAFGLAEKAVRVTVVTSRLRYDDPWANLVPRESVDGVEIARIWTSRFGRGGLLFRAIDYMTFYCAAVWKLLWIVRRDDVVISMTDPPAISIAVAIVTWLRGAHLVNWLQDIFPEVAEALNVGGGSSRFAWTCVRRLRNASLRFADLNVAIGKLMAERLTGLGVPRDRIAVIPNWADAEAIQPLAAAQNRLRADWDLRDRFTIAYSGNLGRAHDTETLLAAIAATAKLPPGARGIRWIFIGGGAGYEHLQRETARCGLGNVSFYPYQPREALAESLSAADVHLVSLKPELEGLIVPSKFYGISAGGRPAIFIGSLDGEIARLLARYECGATVEMGNALALIETILAMARDSESCRLMGQRARAMCEASFSKTNAIATWHGILASIVCSAADSVLTIDRTTQPRESRQEL